MIKTGLIKTLLKVNLFIENNTSMKSYTNSTLKEFNTFHIDALAESIVVFETEQEAQKFFKEYHSTEENYLVIGGGSNLLFTSDFKGKIFKIENKGFQVIDEKGPDVWVKVAAGEEWDDLVAWAVEQGYGGIENLSLIPGTVGAAPVQNIGAYGVEFKDVFNSLECIEIENGEKRTFYLQELEFDYRDSIFKSKLKNKFIITSVVIKLSIFPKLDLHYGHLKEVAQEMSGKNYPDIKDIRQAVIKIRESKLPNTDETGNAGSFFKNPVINSAEYKILLSNYPDLVSYPLENDKYKLAAAWLIEKAGLKGFQLGNAATHNNHALILINNGNATGKEIQELAAYIQEKVKEKFGISLEAEVLMV